MNRILAQLSAEVWAIHKPALDNIIARLDAMNLPSGTSLFAPPTAEQRAELDARAAVTMIPESATRRGPKSGTVAVVPVHGIITYRDSFFSFLFGGTSIERLIATINDLAGNESISAILLDIDSPGGTAAGGSEIAATIRAARDVKNVVSISNPVMASAAYHIGAQADEVVGIASSITGSVGTFSVHESLAGMYEQIGVERTYIFAGKYKVEGNETEPLSDEARAHTQSIVDDYYALFVNDVAQGRNVDAAKVKSDFGEGRVMTAKNAKAAGLIDRIGSFDDTLARLTGSRGQAGVVAQAIDLAIAENTDFASAVEAVVSGEVEPPEPEPTPEPEPETDEANAQRSMRWRVATL